MQDRRWPFLTVLEAEDFDLESHLEARLRRISEGAVQILVEDSRYWEVLASSRPTLGWNGSIQARPVTQGSRRRKEDLTELLFDYLSGDFFNKFRG